MADEKEQPRRPQAGHKLKGDVLQTPDFTAEDASSIQALTRGEANPAQQRLALDWIINFASAYYDQSFRPDSLGGARATDFAEGRRFVGAQIILLTKVKTSKL